MLLISHWFDLEIVMTTIHRRWLRYTKKRSSAKPRVMHCVHMHERGEKWNTCDSHPMDCINFSLITRIMFVFIGCALLVSLLFQIQRFRLIWMVSEAALRTWIRSVCQQLFVTVIASETNKQASKHMHIAHTHTLMPTTWLGLYNQSMKVENEHKSTHSAHHMLYMHCGWTLESGLTTIYMNYGLS